MSNRKYSIAEIDQMRRAVTSLGGSEGAEDRLRTYMLNGTEPEELERPAREKLDVVMERQRQLADRMRPVSETDGGALYGRYSWY